MIRLSLASVLALGVLLAAAATAGARTTAGCQTTFTKGAGRYIVSSSNVPCRTAVPMMKALVSARTIGSVQQGPIRLLKLQGPAGWTCATSSPIRERGAGCRKGTLSALYIKLG